MSTSGILVESVGRDYATPEGLSVRALDGVTLEVPAGTSLAITGPSGCGKSTLLGLIAGLEAPSTGRVWVCGMEVSALGDADRARMRRERLGLVFQADNLLPFLTALENVALQVTLGGAGDHGRAAGLLADLGLSGHADKLPDQLSGGQRQRVAIAGALIKEPQVILADEPTGSLDERSSDGVIELLIDAQRHGGATLVVVTHDPGVAGKMDRVVSLRDGRLLREVAAVKGRRGERSNV